MAHSMVNSINFCVMEKNRSKALSCHPLENQHLHHICVVTGSETGGFVWKPLIFDGIRATVSQRLIKIFSRGFFPNLTLIGCESILHAWQLAPQVANKSRECHKKKFYSIFLLILRFLGGLWSVCVIKNQFAGALCEFYSCDAAESNVPDTLMRLLDRFE